jgi:hypothetical protein
VIYIRCDECKQLFGAKLPTLPPEPGQPEGYLGLPEKIIAALGACGDLLQRQKGVVFGDGFDGVPEQTVVILCPPCRHAAEERGGKEA